MKDSEIAMAFFKMLKSKGFGVKIEDYNCRNQNHPNFDEDAVSFNLLDSRGETFASFDFLGGNFYRISATDSTGWYGDEVDLKKYT